MAEDNIAILIRILSDLRKESPPRLYKLEPSYTFEVFADSSDLDNDETILEVVEYVVSSAVNHEYAHETLLFRSDEEGNIDDWIEVAGRRGTTNHEEVLREIGYTVALTEGTVALTERV
jgi:hypothetical protein